MNYSDSKNQLNILLSNTSAFVFNADEINQILTNAWNDKWATQPIWDTSLTFSASTYQYIIPDGLTTVQAVYIKRSSSNMPEEISGELWEVVNGNLQFNDHAYQNIPDSTVLYLRGRYKVTTDDTVDDVGLQEYIVALAGYNALRFLLFKKTNQFLRNDTSVAEIVATRRELFADLVQWRHQIGTEFVNV